jgi:hypothetical protein
MPSHNLPTFPAAVSLYDARPFFEKALQFGVQHGILDQAKLDAICADAPKGMVQIARYFGSYVVADQSNIRSLGTGGDGGEFLRPGLEKAKDRIVNLVSIFLESESDGDLKLAAELLRSHSLLFCSKAGADMLRALIVTPKSSHFGMIKIGGFTTENIQELATRSLESLAAYKAELAERSQPAILVEAAIWLANALGLDANDLEESGPDAEAVIRTALLLQACKRTEMPDWFAFNKMVVSLRKTYGESSLREFSIGIPKNIPIQFKQVVEDVRQSVLADLPKILDATIPTGKLFTHATAFMGRYFWLEGSSSEVVTHDDHPGSKVWQKATGGHEDEGALITLFLCLATRSAPKTLLTEKAASTLIRKIRKTGLSPELARQFILEHAPTQHQDDYVQLWRNFLEEAQPTLQSYFDYALTDALALLHRECHVK